MSQGGWDNLLGPWERHGPNGPGGPGGAGPCDGARGDGATGGRMVPDGEPIPESLVDRFFDNEMSEAERRAFLRSLPAGQCEDVARMRRMVEMLRVPVSHSGRGGADGPDLTGRIIAAVDKRRGFASRHVRRIARVMRVGLAAGLVLVVGAVAAVERVAPDATRLSPAPAPLTSALGQTRAEVASNLGSIASTLETLQQQVTPAGTVSLVHRVEVSPVAASDGRGLDGRRMLVGLRLGRKGEGGGVSWVGERGESVMEARAEVSAVRGGACERPVVGFIDAEGRCSVLVMPLGIERVGRDDLGAPFVLPGRAMSRPVRPAELLIRASQP